MKGYSPPLQVVEFVATRRNDPDRGPQVRMRSEEASTRLLSNGELAWVYGPRRNELATVVVDESVPRGGVIVRDVAGVAASEIVRVVNVKLDKASDRMIRQ